jgi:hypothetical protein
MTISELGHRDEAGKTELAAAGDMYFRRIIL